MAREQHIMHREQMELTTKDTKRITGHISQIIGPVIDISFEREGISPEEIFLPAIHDSVEIRRHDGRVLIA